MKKATAILLTIFSVILISNGAANAAVPANDGFASATELAMNGGSVSIVASNVDASKETDEPNHAENPGGRSVWFRITPSATTVVRINTMDTTLDTLLAVYTGSNVGSLTRVGYNDDCNNNCGQASTIDLMITAGTTYFIAVDGFNDNGNVGAGSFRLVVLDTGSPLSDNLASAYQLGSSHSGSIAGTNYNATVEANEPAAHTSPNPNPKTVWYRWTASGTSSVAFEIEDGFDSQIGIFTSAVGSPTFAQLVKVNTNYDAEHFSQSRYRTTFFATAGKTYFIKIDWHDFNSTDVAVGNFQLKFYPNRLRYSAKFDTRGERTAIGVFRPQDHVWYSLANVMQPIPAYRKFGLGQDIPVAADFDGDGSSETVAIRNDGGKMIWYINSGGSVFSSIQFGLESDQLVTGDFDRDGRADAAAVRNNGQNLVWYVRQSSDGSLRTFLFGLPFDKPVMGDFDGDGGTDVAVVRQTLQGLAWHILKSNFGNFDQYAATVFGLATDKIAVEDYDGDGRTDIGVYRASAGTWIIRRSGSGELQTVNFGINGDIVQPADYDGDRKADLAVYRPLTGTWYFWFSGTDTQSSIRWGAPTDIPYSSLVSFPN